MKHSDVIVIGSGVAGMTAALASAQQGKSVTLLTYGASSLSLNSGLIDILAFDDEHKAAKSPLDSLTEGSIICMPFLRQSSMSSEPRLLSDC